LHESIFYRPYYRYLVIAGRRASMTIDDRLRLSQMNNDLQDIKIVTYDVLIDRIFRQLDIDPFD
jgi:hypothetical protein